MRAWIRKTGWLALALMPAAIPCAAQEGATPGSVSANVPAKGLDANEVEQPVKNLPDSGLTFLPPLKPTDGVPNLTPESSGDAKVDQMAAEMKEQPQLLDKAVAVINGKVILESDVLEQQRIAIFLPLTAPGAELTRMQAMEQIVNRTLLEDQMDEQQLVPPPGKGEVDKRIAELRATLPACAGQNCETEEGWRKFLAARGVTEEELYARWKEEMAILDFVGARFRTGIRITQPEIENYYKQQLLPEFEQRKLKPPPLSTISDRIEEVLLQQHVNTLLVDYLRSLKESGHVQILDKQYSSLGNEKKTNAAPPEADGAGGDTP